MTTHRKTNRILEEMREDGINAVLVGGKKNDSDKTRMELLPIEALEEIAKVFTFGAKKYDDWNWQKGFKSSRLVGSTMRHLFVWLKGENLDPESGLSHMSHCGCNVLMLIWFITKSRGIDDRRKD